MRILLPLVVIALCAYYYLEMRPPPPAPVAVAVAAVAPTPVPPKLYYHSPLDAPTMPANTHTVGGYYSTDKNAVWKVRPAADGNGLQ